MSETITKGEPARGYVELMVLRNSARGHQIALENKGAIGCYLDGVLKDTAMKQKAYRTLPSSEMHAKKVDPLVSLP